VLDAGGAAVNDLTTTLSEQEQQFLYNLDVLGLTQQRAAEIAGVGAAAYVLKKPSVIAARETIRSSLRTRVNITKDDVIRGIKSAIDQAELLADPMAQIAGWREISKMLGYDAPREIKLVVSGDVKAARKQIAQLGDTDLVQLLEADSVIDADFYPVEKDGERAA
jgi:hypothetical protein